MDSKDFAQFLKRGGRSPSVLKRVIGLVGEFEAFLQESQTAAGLDTANPEDLTAFVESVEQAPKNSAKTHLWALTYYYDYTGRTELLNAARQLRRQRIERVPFALGKFRGVNPVYVEKLAAARISNVSQMLKAGRTTRDRQELSQRTGIPLDAILESVKLSDLTRLGAVKSIRARLYYDAGVDTVAKMAQWDPGELQAMLIEFIERTGFDGIAPLPKEAESTVAAAKRLPAIVEY